MPVKPHILITGATSGLGLGILKHYVHRDWKVTAINRRKDEHLEKQWPSVNFFHFDVRDVGSVRDYFKTASSSNELPQYYFLSAGVNKVDNQGLLDWEVFKEVMDINLMGVYNVVAAALPYLKGKKALFICASSTSNIFPNPNCLGYYLSKLGLHDGFKLLECQHGKNGIHFKSLILGPVATNIFVSGQLSSKLQAKVRELITVTVDQAVPPIVRFIHSSRLTFYYTKRATLLFMALKIISAVYPGFYTGSLPPSLETESQKK